MSVNSLDELVANELNKRSIAANEKLIRTMIEEAKGGYLQSALSLVSGSYESSQKWSNGADKLLAILEAMNCGSAGGYDAGQGGHDRTFVNRLKWVSRALLNEELRMDPITITASRDGKVIKIDEWMRGMGYSSITANADDE